MHRPLAVRATASLVVTALALTATLALGADTAWAPPAPTAPAAPPVALSEVEGVTSGPSALGTTATNARSAAVVGLATQGLDWRAGPTITTSGASNPTSGVAVAPKVSTSRALAPTAPVWWQRYHGVRHVWMPSFGLSKAVYYYACGRSTYPANVVYRWGCAGHNNLYLFGHALGVFSPLYRAYVNHTLAKGMPVVYADGSGHTQLYRVVSWRVVGNTDVSWAIASQRVPSMTLQTCLGANSNYRLIVRLVAVNR